MNINNEEFNKHYSVYSTNADEASLILSYNMMDHMLVIKKKLEKDIQ